MKPRIIHKLKLPWYTATLLICFILNWVTKSNPSIIDLTPYAPIPINQGKIPSCTGAALGYGAMTIEKAQLEGWSNRSKITNRAYSSLFIYNQVHKGRCNDGATIMQAIDLIINIGNIPYSLFDKKITTCHQKPTKNLKTLAKIHRIKKYKSLFNKQQPIPNKIKIVKNYLIQKKVIIVSLQVFENFYQLKKGAKYWWPTQGSRIPAGNHAITVVGYDDKKQSFKLMNSLGVNWGDNGFIWVKYDYFQEYTDEAYVIYL